MFDVGVSGINIIMLLDGRCIEKLILCFLTLGFEIYLIPYFILKFAFVLSQMVDEEIYISSNRQIRLPSLISLILILITDYFDGNSLARI